MGWVPTRPGLGTARLLRLEEIVKEAIPLLNQAIQNQSETSYIITRPEFGPVGVDCVNIGDMKVLPPVKNGVFQFRVCSGDAEWNKGTSVYSTRAFIAGGMEDSFFTSIYATIHAAVFKDEDPTQQERARALCQEVITDWMRARVLNFIGEDLSGNMVNYQTLTLLSKEKWPEGQLDNDGGQPFDKLAECQMASAMPGTFTRDYGANGSVYGMHFLHTGKIR